MKKLFLLVFVATGLIACSNSDDSNGNGPDDQNPAQQGTANIILTAGGEQYKITGPCGWAEAMDTHFIGANDGSNNLKTFSSFFNLESLPSQTTTYTLVKSPDWDEEDHDPTHVWMNITEIRNGGLLEYNSDNASGTLTMVVEGNKITVDLSGIVLQPSEGSPIYENLNVGAFSNPGTLSGTLEFYKN